MAGPRLWKRNMKGRRYSRQLRAAFLVLLCLAGVYLAWPVTTLQVRSGPQNGLLQLALSLSPGNAVTVGFVHSLYQVVQEERYVLRDGKLRLSSVYFGSLDALNYYDPLELLPRKEIEGGYEVIINPPSPLPVHFATAHGTAMWLKLGDDPPIQLERFAHDYDSFSLHVAHWPRAVARFIEVAHG